MISKIGKTFKISTASLPDSKSHLCLSAAHPDSLTVI